MVVYNKISQLAALVLVSAQLGATDCVQIGLAPLGRNSVCSIDPNDASNLEIFLPAFPPGQNACGSGGNSPMNYDATVIYTGVDGVISTATASTLASSGFPTPALQFDAPLSNFANGQSATLIVGPASPSNPTSMWDVQTIVRVQSHVSSLHGVDDKHRVGIHECGDW